MKKVVLGILGLCTCVSLLAGCNGSKPTVASTGFKTVTYHIMGSPSANGQVEAAMNEWNKILKEKINTNLELRWIDWADYVTKINLLFASGERVDLVSTSSTWMNMWDNASQGAFADITNLVEKNMPQTWAELTKEEWNAGKFEGKLICVPESRLSQAVNHGFFYRNDWAKESGIPLPITDYAGMEKYFDYILKAKPGVVPFDVGGASGAQSYYSYLNTITPHIGIAGVNSFLAESYDQYSKLYNPFMDDNKLEEYYDMNVRWMEKGFWRKDTLNFKGDTRELFKAGKTGAVSHHVNTYIGMRTEMDKLQQGSDIQMFAFGEKNNNITLAPMTHQAVAVGKTCQDPARALQVLDLMRNDSQVYRLLNYGREGVNYIIKDGKRAEPEKYDSNTMSYGISNWGPREDKNEIPSITTWSGAADMTQKYVKMSKPTPFQTFYVNKDKIGTSFVMVDEVINKYMPTISAGIKEPGRDIIKEFRAALKAAGIDELRVNLQKQLDEYHQNMLSTK